MQAFTTITGVAATLPLANVDTDVIIRIERLTSLARDALGPYALEALRYRSDGSEDPEFVLNQAPFREAPILVVGPNFGCGSSREGAVWALHARGIRCVIAESFGDIFYANCFQNGILPLRLPASAIAHISQLTATAAALTVDLVPQQLLLPGGEAITFTVDPRRREALLEGADELTQTLKSTAVIAEWQAHDRQARPWVWPDPKPPTPTPTTSSASASDPTGVTGRLCQWLAAFQLDTAPASARERAKALILDGLGCAIVGAQLPWSRKAAHLVQQLEGKGDRTIIGWGAATSAPGAALLNGTFIQGFELDDFHPLAPLHSASVVLPALLASAQGMEEKVSGKRFLQAAMAGFEVGPRVGLALHGAQMLSRGWHSGSVFGTHAAAATVGKLLGLDGAQFEDALGLAATQSAGLMAAQYEAMSKRMHHGFASRNGLYAAVLAHGGYTGIKRVFEREYGGFLSTFGEGHAPDAEQIAADLGQRWEVERIVIKPYAAMGAIHSPLDALFDVARQRPLVASEIAKIEVDVPHAAYHHGWWVPERPLTAIGAQMNIGYALAVAVLDGAALVQQFVPERINADDVWNLLPRIAVRHEPEFDAAGPLKRGRSRVAVTFTDGQRIVVDRQMPRSIESPPSSGDVAAKFRTLTSGLVDDQRQQQIEFMVLALDELSDIRELITLLAPSVGAAFE